MASNHPLASLAGVEMLARGGNIFDAAIATAFALTVVEPMMVGIFGGGTIVSRTADGEITVIDNLSTAPRAATPDMYRPDESSSAENPAIDRENDVGYRAVGVPGTLPAWCELLVSRGKLSLGEVMAPAIRLAADGFRASSFLVRCISETRADMERFPATAEIFLPGGKPPEVGDTIVRREYSRSLETIARDGVNALHDGPLGESICEDIARNGGILTMDDLRGYRIAHRQPIRGIYRGHEILGMAPASSGGTFIVQGLNILEGFDLRSLGFGTLESTHLIAETLKLGFADRSRYMSDPDFIEMPIAALIDRGYAKQRRGLIDLSRASQPGAGVPTIRSGDSGNTTHLTVMDGAGNTIAMTQTINSFFGSRVTVPGTGIILNNNMWLFDPRPGHANSVEPGKRTLSSQSPTIVLRDGQPLFALGTPGGTRIYPAVMQAIVNVIDHGMSLQEAVEAPRVWTSGGPLHMEAGIAAPVRASLAAMGHDVRFMNRVAGGMNGVYRSDDGLLHGAACWRADGCPAGYSGGFTELSRETGVSAGFF